ncbi:MAG: hypothetical protein DCE90_16830 [Pseudanabaena sp.]|nr:MAG: hypothetical protein DCE90_16830 [Pseudanabaena sp.]
MIRNRIYWLGLWLGFSTLSFCASALGQTLTVFTSTDNNATLSAIPTTTNAKNSLNAFIAATSTNTIDFETASTGSGAIFTGGTLTTVNGITFSTNATITGGGGGALNGVTNTTSTAAVGFGTTASYNSGSFIRLDPANGNTFTFTFAAPVSQFGFIITDFGNTPAGANTATFTFLDSLSNSLTISSGITVIDNASAAVNNNSRNARFFGVQSDNDLPVISQATFTVNRPSAGLERFGIDDIRFNTQPVPFEFEGSAGFMLIASYFVGRRYLKNRAFLKK